MMTTTLIILAAGASSRMKKESARANLTPDELRQAQTLSKSLIALGDKGRPLMDYLLFQAQKAGFTEVCLVVGEEASAFRRLYGEKDRNNAFKGLKIHYATQFIPEGRSKPFGTADALLQCLQQFPALRESDFVVCNSDNLYSVQALSLLRHSSCAHALIAYDREALQFSAERIARFALMRFDAGYHLTHIVEKPDPEIVDTYRDTEGMLRVSMNIFRFRGSEIWPVLQRTPVSEGRDEKEIPTTLRLLLKEYGAKVCGIPLSEHVPDLTSKEDIAIMKKELEAMRLEDEWS